MIKICRQFQPDFKSSCHRAKFVLSRFWYLNVIFSKNFLYTYNKKLFFFQNQFKFWKYLLRWVRYKRKYVDNSNPILSRPVTAQSSSCQILATKCKIKKKTFYIHTITSYSSFRINLNFANISSCRQDMIKIWRQVPPNFKSSCHRQSSSRQQFSHLT